MLFLFLLFVYVCGWVLSLISGWSSSWWWHFYFLLWLGIIDHHHHLLLLLLLHHLSQVLVTHRRVCFSSSEVFSFPLVSIFFPASSTIFSTSSFHFFMSCASTLSLFSSLRLVSCVTPLNTPPVSLLLFSLGISLSSSFSILGRFLYTPARGFLRVLPAYYTSILLLLYYSSY